MADESTFPTSTSHPSSSSLPVGHFYQNLDFATLVVYLIIIFMISITGILGNFIVILAIVLCRRLRSTLNWFVLNLACADLLTALCIPFQVSDLLGPNGGSNDQGWLYIILIGIAVSLTTHAFIAITSWYLITKNHAKSKKLFSTRNISIMIGFSWLFTIVIACIIYMVNRISTIFYPALFVEGAWILGHFVIILVSYLKLWRFVARREKKMKPRFKASKQSEIVITTGSDKTNGNPPVNSVSDPSTLRTSLSRVQSASGTIVQESQHLEQSTRMEREQALESIPTKISADARGTERERASTSRTKTLAVTKNLLVVLAAFVLCFIPYPFTVWLDPTFSNIQPWGVALMFFNSCINPIIYARRIRVFRDVMVCIIRCRLGSIPMPIECLRKMRHTG